MDISRMPALGGAQKAQVAENSGSREQAEKNAMNMLQARYGEKPKEARAIKKQLDKDDFMKIMLSEMQHQDPTKPMDADKMANQMAQLTSVEQLKNLGAGMDRMVEKNNASDRLAMSAMIGKSITVDKSRFTHTKGNFSPINYSLPENAARIKLSVVDEHGEEIFSKELEAQQAGSNTYNWDGLGSNGVHLKSGAYSVKIDAENEKGAKIKIDPISHESIMGVAFDGGETNFLVGDPKNPQKVAMKNVIKIEGDALVKNAQEKKLNDAQAAASGLKKPGDDLPEVFKQKIAAAQQKQEPSQEQVKPEGFANGLGE